MFWMARSIMKDLREDNLDGGEAFYYFATFVVLPCALIFDIGTLPAQVLIALIRRSGFSLKRMWTRRSDD